MMSKCPQCVLSFVASFQVGLFLIQNECAVQDALPDMYSLHDCA